jgi:hypothetical protein
MIIASIDWLMDQQHRVTATEHNGSSMLTCATCRTELFRKCGVTTTESNRSLCWGKGARAKDLDCQPG